MWWWIVTRSKRRNFPAAKDAEFWLKHRFQRNDPKHVMLGRYLSTFGYVREFVFKTFKRTHEMDFALPEKRVAIFFGSADSLRKRARDEELRRHGWHIIRFATNVEIRRGDTLPLIMLAHFLLPLGFKREYPLQKIVGEKFARQRVDFAHVTEKIVIEYDGTGHHHSQAYDNRRDIACMDAGWTVIRIPFRRYQHQYVQEPNPSETVAFLYRDLDLLLGVNRKTAVGSLTEAANQAAGALRDLGKVFAG